MNVLSPLIDKNTDYKQLGLIETKNLKFLETINIIFLIFSNILWYYLYGPLQDISPLLKSTGDMDLVFFRTIYSTLLYIGPIIMLFISVYKRNMINKLQDAILKGEKNETKYYCKGLEKLRNIFALFIIFFASCSFALFSFAVCFVFFCFGEVR